MSKKHPMINSALRRAGGKLRKDIALSNGDVVKMSQRHDGAIRMSFDQDDLDSVADLITKDGESLMDSLLYLSDDSEIGDEAEDLVSRLGQLLEDIDQLISKASIAGEEDQ